MRVVALHCLVIAVSCVSAGSDSQEEDHPYYGVPLGALHYSAEKTRAEVYAADEYTIIFHHFAHQPKEDGCTAVMIGPKRAADRNSVSGEGVLLAISQPMFTSSQPRSRPTRQAPFNLLSPSNWPVEFDHLKLPKGEKSRTLASPLDPFAGIELDIGQAVDTSPQAKDIIIKSVAEVEENKSASNDNDIKETPKRKTAPRKTPARRRRPGNPARVRGVVTARTTTATEGPLTTVEPTTEESSRDVLTSHPTEEVSTDSSDRGSDQQPIILFKKPEKDSSSSSTVEVIEDSLNEATTPLDAGIIDGSDDSAMDLADRSSVPTVDDSAVFSDKHQEDHYESHEEGKSTSGPQDSGMMVRLSGPLNDQDRETRFLAEHELNDDEPVPEVEWVTKPDANVRDKDGRTTVMLGETTTRADWPRRAPARHHSRLQKGERIEPEILSDKFFDTKNIVPVSTQGSTPSSVTPLYYVIEDPRAKRRRVKQLRKVSSKGLSRADRTSTALPKTRPRLERKYALPVVKDKTAAFTLTNGAKINDYQWIGLYDQCKKRAIPLVALKGVDPPREEKIAPISGWSHNVTSYRVQILNCNSLLIPGFVFNGTDAPEGTFFYVGVGHFPDNIERQVRASIVGHPVNQSLRSYTREDVMLRLPKTYRTFDIDFLTLYNDVEQRSYGHVIIPSLLVPPCTEDE